MSPLDEDDTVEFPVARGPGADVGDFELLEEIGRGGMGVVYRARQKSLDRIVALKMFMRAPFHEDADVARFLDEARAIARLDHPGIVEVYQVGESVHGHYFAMRFVEGESLDALVREGQLPAHRAVLHLIRVARAVHYAHAKGIVHRDLKPANVMIDKFGRPIVMDFGVAKFIDRSSRLTRRGVGVGTPAYMPPEQVGESPERVGPRSDVYSLGGILYTALTGRPPFEGATVMDTLLRVKSEEMPTPIRDLAPGVPEELERICMKCLAKDPSARYPTAKELADALQRFLNAHGGALKSMGSPPAAASSVRLIEQSSGKVYQLASGSFVIGRTKSCNVILEASNVSKQHCRVFRQGKEIRVKDLGSANGTFLNGHRVYEAVLEDGDVLQVARHRFEVQIGE